MGEVGFGSLVGLTFILNVGDFDQSISIMINQPNISKIPAHSALVADHNDVYRADGKTDGGCELLKEI